MRLAKSNGSIALEDGDVVVAVILAREIEGTKVRPSSVTAAIASVHTSGQPDVILIHNSPKGGFTQLPYTIMTGDGSYAVNDAIEAVIISNR